MRVFLNSPGRVTCDAFSRLAGQGLATVVGCLTTAEQAADVRESFPGVRVVVREELFSSGLSGTFHDVDARILTPELLASLDWAQSIALEMMDRIDVDRSQRYRDRRDLFLYLVAYWVREAEGLDIDVFYSQETPHEVADFVLFAVMKALERKTLLFSRTLILGEWFLADDYRYPRTVYHWSPADPRRSRRAADSDEEIVRRHIAPVRGTYSDAIATYLNYMNAVSDEAEAAAASGRIRSTLERAKREREILAAGAKSMSRSLGEIRARPGPTTPNALGRVASAWLTYASASDLSTSYRHLATIPETSTPYVYFLLGYQPENTNCPEGSAFGNQLLAVSLLARCIPTGWRVIVKEHPAQLANDGRGASGYGNLGREASLYAAIAALPNVELASLDSDHFNLVDSSTAVATLTGTAGWEATLRGKPVLCFGEAWYQSAPNVWRVRTTADCVACLDVIASGTFLTGPDLDAALVAFIREITGRTHTMVLNEWDADVTGLAFDYVEQRKALEGTLTGYVRGELMSSTET